MDAALREVGPQVLLQLSYNKKFSTFQGLTPSAPRFGVEVHSPILVNTREPLASVHPSDVPVKSRQLAGVIWGL
jgi:hypothetical protein